VTLRSLPRRPALDGVHYTVTGDGPSTVVLLHGFADNLSTWNRVVPRLAVAHRVIAVDLPGFGASSRPWRERLLEDYVDVVRDVLDAEGIDDAVSLVGNSMGAAVSTLFAARHPERAARVVLIDMPGLHSVPRLWDLAMSRPAELGLRTAFRVVPESGARYGLSWAYGRIAAADRGRLDPSVMQGFTSPYLVRGSVVNLLPVGRALLRELRTAQLGAVLAGLTVPTLVVFGARDLLTPARVLRRIKRDAGTVVLPGCGHCPQIDQPGELVAAIEPFLRADEVPHQLSA
jgi:pimeloyl-ACP methyl ester carboxylesterase